MDAARKAGVSYGTAATVLFSFCRGHTELFMRDSNSAFLTAADVMFYERVRTLVEAPAGANLLEVLRKNGLRPDAPCGGRDKCGKCKVMADADVLVLGAGSCT